MFKNYFKIAFRTLLRDRSFSILNLLGLAVGLASVMMILGYIRYELSYDKFYSNYPRVYRLIQQEKPGSLNERRVNVNMGMGGVLKKEFPAISAFTSVGKFPIQFKYNNEVVKIDAIEGERDFFKVFNYQFVQGNAASAFSEPGSMVITERTAARFFKGKAIIGSLVTDKYGKVRHVSGVIKDIPQNTHLTGDAVVIGEPDTEAFNMESYTSMPQYVLLNKNADAGQLAGQFKSIYKKYKFPQGAAVSLQPVTEIHLKSHYFSEISVNSDIKYIYIFSSIALLILFIACVNYINLTTARSLQRAREIGLRKVLGALRKQLVVQFLTESFLFFLVSTLFAVVIAYTVWPFFSAKITAYQQIIPLFNFYSLTGILLVFVIGGLLSGAYPAFFLSSLQPVKVLKGLTKFGVNLSLRKVLVVMQFAISGVLIIATMVVNRQLNYIRNTNLGFNKDNLVEIPFEIRKSHIDVFKNELLKSKDIKAITVSSWRMGKDLGGWNAFKDLKDTSKQVRYNYTDADLDFVKTMGIRLVAGRNFSPAYALDMISPDSAWRMSKKLKEEEQGAFRAKFPILLNQAAVKALGLTNPVGQTLNKPIRGTVIGVVEDFNGMSLHQKIDPVIISSHPGCEQGSMYVRISSANISQTMAYIQNQWKKFYPDNRFEFTFTDDKLQELYTADKRLGSLFGIFSSLAIFIACLGLFGLISLTVQNRVKEIGIRKVLGASVANIAALISADFLKLVLISFVISSPIAWYFMNAWLQDFAYRINVEWWIFALACAVTILIAMATLSFQSIKAAVANPVKNLRSE